MKTVRTVDFRYTVMRNGADFGILRPAGGSWPRILMDDSGEIKTSLSGSFVPPEGQALAERILRHGELELAAKGDHGMVELRKHLPLYFTGRRGASALKKALSQVKTMEELRRLLLDRDGCDQYNSMN